VLQQAANVETKIERVSGISPVQSVRDQPGRTPQSAPPSQPPTTAKPPRNQRIRGEQLRRDYVE
jgi:hypothetical protein